MVGVRHFQDSVIELLEIVEVRRRGEESFYRSLKQAVRYGPFHCCKSSLAHDFLVVKQAQYFIEISGIDRLGYISQPARFQDAPDFSQRLVHLVHGNMV